MTQASKIEIQDVDNSFRAQGSATGVSGFVGRFSRGPINDASIVITSPTMLRKIFGSKDSGSGDLLLADRALAYGGRLRIVNVAHYTDPADPSTLSAVKAGAITVNNAAAPTPAGLFKLVPKYAGAEYNKLKVEIKPNSVMGTFSLTIYIDGERQLTEENYSGLLVDATTIADASFLSEVALGSLLVDVEYMDTSAISAANRIPAAATLTASGGTNGGAVVAADFIGTQSGKNGFYALSPYSDFFDFGAPAITDIAVHIGGATFASNKEDVEYLAGLSNALVTAAQITTTRQSITVDSKYYSVWAGGLIVKHPITGQNVEITNIADIMGIGHRTDKLYAPWMSQAQAVRGQIINAVGVVNNFGDPGDFAELDLLAQAGVNVTIADAGTVNISGNFSGQKTGDSKASYRNVVRLLIYIKKSLRPTLKRYLEEPTDFITFKNLFNEVSPFLQELMDNRAVQEEDGAVWNGDQLASKMSELKYNTQADLAVGKYYVELFLIPIASLKLIKLAISINNSSATISDL